MQAHCVKQDWKLALGHYKRMPKDAPHKQKSSAKKPVPLHDSNAAPFASTRISVPVITASNVTSRKFSVLTQQISGLLQPLDGDYDEALYARTADLSEDVEDMMDIDSDGSVGDEVIQSGLPGIILKKKVQRYVNSVCFSFFLFKRSKAHDIRIYHSLHGLSTEMNISMNSCLWTVEGPSQLNAAVAPLSVPPLIIDVRTALMGLCGVRTAYCRGTQIVRYTSCK